MPKVIELTVEIEVQKVSCPGVWLCQDGRVSLSVSALGTNYQTCLLPPVFPLSFKDIFYFKKRFQETCAMNNMCCLLKDETMYCELVQWSENFKSGEYVTLAQYLGSITDILFPPNMCFNDGVDLLMRRTKNFPGILSPKIEIATKVRIDEINQSSSIFNNAVKTNPCQCSVKESDGLRQKQVCHSAQYHRSKCLQKKPPISASILGSGVKEPALISHYRDYSPKRISSLTDRPMGLNSCSSVTKESKSKRCECAKLLTPMGISVDNAESQDNLQRLTLESHYVNECNVQDKKVTPKYLKNKITPCVCEICKRYHELFHAGKHEYAS